jgi:hypothetical protein
MSVEPDRTEKKTLEELMMDAASIALERSKLLCPAVAISPAASLRDVRLNTEKKVAADATAPTPSTNADPVRSALPSSSKACEQKTVLEAAPKVIVVPVNPLLRVATSNATVSFDWLVSCRSVQPVGSVVVVSALPCATIVRFPVNALWLRTGAAVPAAWLFCDPLLRTASAPTRDIPLIATDTTQPDVFEPVATVITVEVVFAINAVRMKTERR